MTVSIQGVDKVHVFLNGVNIKQALSAANETVNKGLYDSTTLSTVDTDLATANIKSGITIFGKVGSASVLDISDADAAVTDVKDPRTFYSVTGPRKTGTMPTVALAADNTAYLAGYHAGAASLQAVDGDLTPANIKTGVNIFGYVGTYDTTASAPTAAQIILNKVAWANGAQITGTMPTVTLIANNTAYPTGYHAGAANLATIDADLAVGNIKTGVNIFGYVGTYDTTASAPTAAQMILNRVAWANGAQITGTMPTVTIASGSNNYPAGYHAGAAGLSTIEASLAAANIKSGINIFGFVGPATVQDISAADAAVTDVKAPRTFFSVTGAIKTGTLATVALDPAANAYPGGYHAGAASLTAVDADLAAANIKSGVTIFGVLGTLSATPTVTERKAPVAFVYSAGDYFGAETSWTTKATVSIPASEKGVIAIAWVRNLNAGYQAAVRIVYNGVEKASYTTDSEDQLINPVDWEGAGVGVLADVLLQWKVISSGAYYGMGGCVYSITT